MLPTELPPYTIVYVGEIVYDFENVPVTFSIESAYPNPFNPSTTISFNLAEANNVRVDIFNSAGQKVDTLADSFMNAGSHAIVWNAAGKSSGVYYVRVTSGISARSVKVTLVK